MTVVLRHLLFLHLLLERLLALPLVVVVLVSLLQRLQRTTRWHVLVLVSLSLLGLLDLLQDLHFPCKGNLVMVLVALVVLVLPVDLLVVMGNLVVLANVMPLVALVVLVLLVDLFLLALGVTSLRHLHRIPMEEDFFLLLLLVLLGVPMVNNMQAFSNLLLLLVLLELLNLQAFSNLLLLLLLVFLVAMLVRTVRAKVRVLFTGALEFLILHLVRRCPNSEAKESLSKPGGTNSLGMRQIFEGLWLLVALPQQPGQAPGLEMSLTGP